MLKAAKTPAFSLSRTLHASIETMFTPIVILSERGKGNLLGVILAVLTLGVIRNGMVHLGQAIGLSYYWREVGKGLILILAISLDAARIIAAQKKQRTRPEPSTWNRFSATSKRNSRNWIGKRTIRNTSTPSKRTPGKSGTRF